MDEVRIPQYIPAKQVRLILNWPSVNNAVKQALKLKINPENVSDIRRETYGYQPQRTITSCDRESNVLLTMPAFVGNSIRNSGEQFHLKTSNSNTLACKLVTSFTGNRQLFPPLPNILANILLFNSQTGELECIMNGTDITAWRTAAASIVATEHLLLTSLPGGIQQTITIAIIGCGVQGEHHALGLCKTFNVAEVHLWNRTQSKADQLSKKLSAVLPNSTKVFVRSTAADAVQHADVISIATYATTALIDYTMLKTDGPVHINAVGAGQVHYGEVAQDIYDNSVVYVDSMTSADTELKGLRCRIIGEVGDVLRHGKRNESERITIFQSMGMAVEDAVVARAVFDTLKSKSAS